MTLNDQGFSGGVPSLSLKHAYNPLVSLTSADSLVYDDCGVVIDVARMADGAPPRSMKLLLRRVIQRVTGAADSLNYFYLQSTSGLILSYLYANRASITTVNHFITHVKAAYAAATKTAADFSDADTAKTVNPNFGSTMEMLGKMMVAASNGHTLLDDIGGVFSSGLYRLNAQLNYRLALRRMIAKDATTGRFYLRTVAGQITRMIQSGSPADVAAIMTIITNLANVSYGSTIPPIAGVPTDMPMSSIIQMLFELVIIGSSDSTFILDTVGLDNNTADNKRKVSLFKKFADLVTANSESTPTRFFKTSHGVRWYRVAQLNPATASFSDLWTALSAQV